MDKSDTILFAFYLALILFVGYLLWTIAYDFYSKVFLCQYCGSRNIEDEISRHDGVTMVKTSCKTCGAVVIHK